MFVKFILNVWKNKIVPTLSEVYGATWLEFDRRDGEYNVVQTSCRAVSFNWSKYISTCPYGPQSSN